MVLAALWPEVLADLVGDGSRIPVQLALSRSPCTLKSVGTLASLVDQKPPNSGLATLKIEDKSKGERLVTPILQ